MSTTVTYKGSTLTTVNNETKTLTTQGKYLEDNITLVDITSGGEDFIVLIYYDDVEEVWKPDKTWAEIEQAYSDGKYIYATTINNQVNVRGSWDSLREAFYYEVDVINTNISVTNTYYILAQEGVEELFSTEYIIPSLQTKTATYTPTESQQTDTITADSEYDGLDEVNVSVAAISSSYVGSGIPRKSASDLTQNHQSITAPSGYYSANATFTMAQALGHLTASVDTSGMVTATYDFLTAGYQASGGTAYSMQLTSLAASTYTPSATAQTIPSQRWLVGAQTIEAIPSAYIIPSGTSSIIANGIYDITSFASVDISVSGVTPTGTYSVTSNGIYDITSYASVDVNVSGGGGGITADEIAMMTISGVVSGSASFIGSYAFYRCTALTTANFSNAASVGASAFYYCENLASVNMSNLVSIGSYGFYHCGLSAVNFPSATTISTYAFAYNTSLKEAIFPKVTFFSTSAFYSCTSLEVIEFQALTTILAGYFSSLYKLRTAKFSSIGGIAAQAFRGCRELLSLYLLGSSVVPLVNTNAFSSTPISTYTTYTGGVRGSIYVPASLYSTYIASTNWSIYAERFVSL